MMDNEILLSSTGDTNLEQMSGKENAVNGNASIALDESLLIEAGFEADFSEGNDVDENMTANDSGHSGVDMLATSTSCVTADPGQITLSGLPGEDIDGQIPVSGDFGDASVGDEAVADDGAGSADAVICPPPPFGFEDTSPGCSVPEVVPPAQNGGAADAEEFAVDQPIDLGVHLDFGDATTEVQESDGVHLDFGDAIAEVQQSGEVATVVAPPDDQETVVLSEETPEVLSAHTGVSIHLESKDETCHLSEPTVSVGGEEEKKQEEDDKLNPEEEEAALKFLQLQEQKKQEDDFDDEFDVGDLPDKPTVTVPALVITPARVLDPVKSEPEPRAEQAQSRSTFYDKDQVGDVQVGKPSQEKTPAPTSVFYTGTQTISEKQENVGASTFYAPTGAQDSSTVGENGDAVARPLTAGKEITQFGDDLGPLLRANGKVVDPNERGQDYSLDGSGQNSQAALQAARAEWDTVETITPAVDGNESDDSVEGIISQVKTTPSITYEEAFGYLRDTDLTRYKPQIRQTINRGAWGSFKHAMFGPPKLQKNLLIEREMVFLIAACPYDNREEPHFQVLQTIYKKLMGSKFDCQRYGDHWELVGFQGTDPSTDLRATGLLGLLTILYLVTDQKTWPLARDIYKLSLHETQNFPFCVMSINMARIALQCLREESLNKECNRRQTVMSVFNDIYAGSYLYMYQIWKSQHKTIKDSGYVIKDVETYVKKNPKGVIKNLETFLSGSGKAAVLEDGNIMNFAGVCDMGANEDDGDLV